MTPSDSQGRRRVWVERLTWVLIYAGLLLLLCGLVLLRQGVEWANVALVVGAGLALAGVLLIGLRARL